MIDSVRYPGGKGKCFQRLINMMPPHDVYIESHLGGGAVLRNKRPAQSNYGIDIDPEIIRRWARRYPSLCSLINSDAATFLQQFSFKGTELVYSDPPYVPSLRRKARVYRYDYELDQHERLLEILKGIKCNVMISGYEGTLYAQALHGWQRVSFSVQSHVGPRTECVWTNFDPPPQLHDGSFLGATFRERQTVRRRQSRWLERFDRMAPSERQHLLGLLNSRFLGDAT
jgi:DNA adenine methylase